MHELESWLFSQLLIHSSASISQSFSSRCLTRRVAKTSWLSPWVFVVHLDSGKADRGISKEKATKCIWTLPLIYRLEAGVIKRFQSGIQMRNLVCDLWTQGNENFCFACDVGTPSKRILDPFWGTVWVEGSKSYSKVMVLSGSFSPSSWMDVDFYCHSIIWISHCSCNCYMTGVINVKTWF